METTIIVDQLTCRQSEVLHYTALGLTAKQIGDKLSIAPDTAKRHRGNIFLKLNVYSSVEAVAVAMSTDQAFYARVRDAVLSGQDKPENGKNRGGPQPGGFGWKENDRAQS